MGKNDLFSIKFIIFFFNTLQYFIKQFNFILTFPILFILNCLIIIIILKGFFFSLLLRFLFHLIFIQDLKKIVVYFYILKVNRLSMFPFKKFFAQPQEVKLLNQQEFYSAMQDLNLSSFFLITNIFFVYQLNPKDFDQSTQKVFQYNFPN